MVKKVMAGCLAAAVLGGVAYYSSYLYSSRQLREDNARLLDMEAREELVLEEAPTEETKTEDAAREGEGVQQRRETSTDPDAVQAETGEYSYYLVEEFGYVNIYRSDRRTIYEYTDIALDSLPEGLKEEISAGKGIAGEQELYDFLENYSS